MLKRANINWNAKQLVKMMEKGTINFENAVQRGFVWDDKRKSLLIHSMMEGYPIPAFYAAKSNGIYDMLDGKQRSNAIADFVNGIYPLKDVPDVISEDGESVVVNGKMFSELNEEFQDVILSYSLTVYYFEDITDEQITEMFFRLNNGKPLTSIELTRVKAKSIETIKQIGSHEIFTSTLTESAMNRYTNEDIVIKSWIMLNEEHPCWDTKFVRPIMENVEMTEDDVKQLNQIFDKILECYKAILELEDSKEAKKIAKRVITRTHLISLVPVIKESIENDVVTDKLVEWLWSFFNGETAATISVLYNDNSNAGSGHETQVMNRVQALKESYKTFMNW